jgi:hypothetical protein
MIMDITVQFSNNQAITADAASTNIVDLGAPRTVYGAAAPVRQDIGGGVTVPLIVTVTETFNTLTSMNIQVQVDNDVAFGTPKTVFRSPEYALADLAVGARYLLPDWLPVGTDERYVRLFYDITGGAPTLGKITAGVTWARQNNDNR